MKKILAIAFLAICGTFVQAQEESPLQLGADIMSRYVWRGLDLGGNSPSIQPYINYSLSTSDSKHALTIGAWGAYTFSETSNQEVDIFASYTFNEMFSLTVTDYFFPGLYDTKERSRYFNYNADSTCHLFEGVVSFNGTEKIPVTLLFAMNFYGNDALKLKEDGSADGIFMSKYIEVGYASKIKGTDVNAFIGATLDKPNKERGETGFYGNEKAGIINVGIKAVKNVEITEKFSLPIQASLIANPESEKLFFVFGISF
jgi:hypothetical protein